MTDRKLLHFGYGAIMLLAVLISPGIAATQAQDLHLPPGTDCSKILIWHRNECIRTMRRLELRELEKQGLVVPAPGRRGIVILDGKIPGGSHNPYSLVPQGSAMETPSGGTSGN